MSNTIAKIGTHNGMFHADDIFAVATLQLLYPDAEVIRSRDENELAMCDLVVDVGGVYDHSQKRYDHHQQGFAETHDNGVLRCGFGLVWKHYGLDLSKSTYVYDKIDKGLVMTIDGLDNGQEIAKSNWPDVNVHTISNYFLNFNPAKVNATNEDYSEIFFKLLPRAQEYLQILLNKYSQAEQEKHLFLDAYAQVEDKKWVALDNNIEFNEVAIQQPELLYVIFPSTNNEWGIKAIAPSMDKPFNQRLSFPDSWRGKTAQELEVITHISGAKFCHMAGFFAVANTKEAAISLAQESLRIQNVE